MDLLFHFHTFHMKTVYLIRNLMFPRISQGLQIPEIFLFKEKILSDEHVVANLTYLIQFQLMCQYRPLKDDKMTTSWSYFHLRKTETKAKALTRKGDQVHRRPEETHPSQDAVH